MSDYRAPLKDIQFVIHDVWQSEPLWQSLPGLEEVDRSTADAILEEAAKICAGEIAPLNRRGDEQGCQWRAQEVISAEGFADAYQAFGAGGWIGLGGNPEYEGMGMPKSLVSAVEEMLQGACMSFGLAPMLTAGACLAIDAHGDSDMKALYLPKLYSGAWSAAMDLTEPNAGTDLGLMRTRAEPNADGSYSLTGSKMFITWGEHDLTENIVHLVLAKLPDAPAGTRGISMFLVPKFLPTPDGSLGARNRVSCGSLEKKMGIKGSPTCVMNYDQATGWLVGTPNQGLACMFTMMNYERLVVGIQAVGAAEASYQSALHYARERRQGRRPEGPLHPDQPADPLLVHPDVRRMLMIMKAFNEGSRAFYVYVAQWLDVAKYAQDPARKKLADDRVALMTPVAKAFISDMAFDTAVHGQQVFGGHGYVQEWGQEQHVRDIRITQIYEGTNGIQAMDLVGRKTIACQGSLLFSFGSEIKEFAENHSSVLDELKLREDLLGVLAQTEAVTQKILEQAKVSSNALGAAAVDYLHLVGYLAYAYMWAKMACTAQTLPSTPFAQAKIATAQFYFSKLLPQTQCLQKRIEAGWQTTMALQDDQF